MNDRVAPHAQPRLRLAVLASALVLLAACSSATPSGVPGPTDSGGPPAAATSHAPGTGNPDATTVATPALAAGHYSIDVHNLASGGKWNLPGHHELDAPIECFGSDTTSWGAKGVYIPGTPDFPGGDIGLFQLTTTAGHREITISMMTPISDNPYDWRVADGDHYGETFDFHVSSQAIPMTITAKATNKYETISIALSCSSVATTP